MKAIRTRGPVSLDTLELVDLPDPKAPGPGEITTPSGASRRTSSTVPASLRHTTVSAPSSPRYWTRLNTNES